MSLFTIYMLRCDLLLQCFMHFCNFLIHMNESKFKIKFEHCTEPEVSRLRLVGGCEKRSDHRNDSLEKANFNTLFKICAGSVNC